MAKQTILWSALPNGYSPNGRTIRVSLLMSPRLEPDAGGDLSNFPDFVDWPATIRRTRFVINFGKAPLGTAVTSVTIAGDQVTGRNRVDDRLALPESEVWQALFPETTRVHGYVFRDLTKHEVLSYPAEYVDGLVRDLYTRLAATATDQLPTAATFINDPRWSDVLNTIEENDVRYYDREKGIRLVEKQFEDFRKKALDADTAAAKLTRFQLFHTPPSTPKRERYRDPVDIERQDTEWLGYEQSKLPSPAELEKEIDFHKIVTAMSQYPVLMRKLGLVLDFTISRDLFTQRPDGLLWAEVQLPNADPVPDPSPRTHALLDDRRFQPVPKAPAADFRVADGLLELDPKKFSLLQADVDGSGHKVMNFARSLIEMRRTPAQQDDPVTKQKRELGAPALRNAGLMLIHKQRASMLKNAIAKQSGFQKAATDIQAGANPATTAPKMFAEDVVRGYRVDIWEDVSKKWRSLCQRQATYNVTGLNPIDVPTEEGTVKLAATTSPDPKSNPDIIWLHETLVSWTGWSLCVAPPGKTIHHQATRTDADGKEVVVHEDPVKDADVEVPPGIRLKTEFQILKNSLPRLRYGRRYWLRARAVDLAGNSLDFQLKDFGPEQSETSARPYFRYEPISAPAIALSKPTPATTLKPREGESMERMAIRSFNDTPNLNTVATVERTQRVAVPSRTTQREAEQHGMLDKGGIVDPAFFATLATKDNSLAEETIMSAGPLPLSPEVATGYSVMVDGDELPYIPEPLAVRVAARILDHPSFPANKVITIPFYANTEWPNALPFKIEIYEDPADAPRFDPDVRTLFIPLPKATRVTLRLSVKPTAEALQVMGVWNWLTPAQQSSTVVVNGETMTLERLAAQGQHWMLTPWRNLELVHAVQRPLLNPDISEISNTRGINKTFTVPKFSSACHIASTDRLDLRAVWNEPREAKTGKPLENLERIDHAFSIKITDSKSYNESLREYRDLTGNRIDVGKARFPAPKVHEFHDTRYRRIEYWLEATTKFREFFPQSVLTEGVKDEIKPTEKNIRVVGARVRDWVKSSAPPPAPEVLYVMPTFGWVRSGDETSRKSWRRGGGLRVYLDRPWNVSGYGEMLAVVLPGARFEGDPNNTPAHQPLKNFVTQWGNDPIWESPFVSGPSPRAANFPLARTQADPDGKWLPAGVPIIEADQPPGRFSTTQLQHPELKNLTGEVLVDIAPHDVFYDEERQLWYCDIELTWGASYCPFIRLALARYQPVALDRAHLSNVVIADFMPLIPDRWLNVTQTRDPRTRRLRVFGHTYSDSSGDNEARANRGSINVAASSVVKVWVERFDPALGEDFGWSKEPRAVVNKDGEQPPPAPAIAGLRATSLVRYREFEALLDENLIDQVFLSPTLWSGTVTLPEAAEDVRFRLVIAEYEEYLIDDSKPYDYPVTEKGQRVVFVEYVELQ